MARVAKRKGQSTRSKSSLDQEKGGRLANCTHWSNRLHHQERQCSQRSVWHTTGLGLRASSPFVGYHEKQRREGHARGDAKANSGVEKGELAIISTPETPDIAKAENCHRKRAAD